MKTATKEQLKSKSIIELSQGINQITQNAEQFMPLKAKKWANELADRLSITPIQAVFLAMFMDMFDDNNIRPRDIAHHFDVRPLSVMGKMEDIEGLVEKGFIMRRLSRSGEKSFMMEAATLNNLIKGISPKPEEIDNLTTHDFMAYVSKYLNSLDNGFLDEAGFEIKINALINKNMHLHVASKLKSQGLHIYDLTLFLAIAMMYINDRDEHVISNDVNDLFDEMVMRAHTRRLADGTHILMKKKLVDHACDDGRANPNAWRLSDYAKEEIFTELNLKPQVNIRSNMTLHEDINAKEMFYPQNVTSQVGQLEDMLNGERMERIMKRLAEHGMRKGFTCLFYGAPGTGKTETVMQLARLTGRDIMVVDIPNIRSKWVGDTEKNIKAVFERYRKVAKDNANAPILLFNEADALFNRRNNMTETSVDKMENAMQNIILQELENLEGILIATTNLTGNLDPAFERRFLYKIEFEKPTANERKHIWKAMLGELTDEQALSLAQRYEFSGGQIENIARKRIITDILADRDTIDIDSIIESCNNELLNKDTTRKRVGF